MDLNTVLSAGAILAAAGLGALQEIRNRRAATEATTDTLRSADTTQAITGLSLAEQAQQRAAHDCQQQLDAARIEITQLRTDLTAALERIDQLEARP